MRSQQRRVINSFVMSVVTVMYSYGIAAENAQPWPQAAGPNISWQHDVQDAPTHWSVARNQHIKWRTPLPNAGQGGIAVADKKLFLATFPEQIESAKRQNNVVLGHALDRVTGQLLWSVSLKGERPSPQLYAFSDSTSWTPICDDQYVWFFNASGEMGCWDHNGKEIWRRTFRTQPPKYPFNRQCEPILSGDLILTVEPKATDDVRYDAKKDDWHFIHAIHKKTGRVAWISDDGCTFYCTPVLSKQANGNPGLLFGRGGPHGVPEIPIGLSLINISQDNPGKNVWRFTPEAGAKSPLDGTTWMAQYNQVWDSKAAYWFRNTPEETHVIIDVQTGQIAREQSLIKAVDVCLWDTATQAYQTQKNMDIRTLPDATTPLKTGEVLHVLPQWHSNIVAHGYHWFLCTTNNRRNGHAPKGHSGPAHCLGRIALATGKVEYLELPVGVERLANQPDKLIYGKSLKTKPLDNQGRDVADEGRSRTDGWEIDAFFASPIVLGEHLYISVMLGVTYVINTKVTTLDQRALVAVNDLGPLGETWSLSGPSYANGMLYHRSVKEIVAITKP